MIKPNNTKRERFKIAQYIEVVGLLVAVIVVGGWIYSYSFSLFPEQLQNDTSLTNAPAPIPRSVRMNVSGHYATIHIYSGPDKGQPLSLEGVPTMSQYKTDGRSIIKIKVVADPNNVVVSPNSDFDYAISLAAPLDAGQYKVMVTMSSIRQAGAGAHSPYILTSDFQIR